MSLSPDTSRPERRPATRAAGRGTRHRVITRTAGRSLTRATDAGGWRMTGMVRASARPKPRTLKTLVLRVVVPRLLLFGAVASVLGLGQVLAVDPSAHSSAVPERHVSAVPTWKPTDEQAFPGCRALAEWPSGTPAAYLVVHSFRDRRTTRMAFDVAWGLNHDDTEADDVWVIGVCGRP